jgi:hypothetical protein
VAAAICGVFFDVSGKIVGGIAALPPLLAFVGANLKLEARASWHYRKSNELSVLRSRLLYEMPEIISADHVAAISAARSKLTTDMETEWDTTITVNWANVTKQLSASKLHSTESEAAADIPKPD